MTKLARSWARRIEAGLSAGAAVVELSNPVIQDEAFLEAADVFLAPLPLEEDVSPAVVAVGRALGRHLGLSDERVAYSLHRRVPDFTPASTSSTSLSAGRVRLAVKASSQAVSSHFALTKPSRRLLEQITAAVRAGESPLLVGETGTGKTAITGFLAASVGKRLVALNMSNQSEAGDLLGGFKPINAAEEARGTQIRPGPPSERVLTLDGSGKQSTTR